MNKIQTLLFRLSANTCAIFGVISVICAIAAIENFELIFEITKPLAIISLVTIFPLFIAFVLIRIKYSIASNGKNTGKKKGINTHIRDTIDSFLEPLKALLSISKVHLVVFVLLIISGGFMYHSFQIGGVSWAFGTPFEKHHAISFGTTAALFYAIMLPYYSYKASQSTYSANET